MKNPGSAIKEHGPLPWDADVKNLVVADAYGNVVADCDVETFRVEKAANTELIALACNSHYKLLEALSWLAGLSAVVCTLHESHCEIRPDVWGEMCRASRAALAAVDETERPRPAAGCRLAKSVR